MASMAAVRLNRTSVGLKLRLWMGAARPDPPGLNRTSVGLKRKRDDDDGQDGLTRLNRTSVGLKRGFRCGVAGDPGASIEPAWD